MPPRALGARLVRGPRERNPQAVGPFEEAARLLAAHGQPALAGWLLASLVDAELRRPGALELAARRLAVLAASLLARGGEPLSAAEIALASGDREGGVRLLQAAGQTAAARQVGAGERPRYCLGESLPGLIQQPRALVASEPGGVRGGLRKALRWLESHDHAERVPFLAATAGLPRDAARVARETGRPELAGECWAQAGAYLEAGRAFLEAGQTERALAQLVLVPHEHPRHRVACVLAIRLARRLGTLPFELDHLIGPMLRAPPRDATEVEAFRHLADLFADHGMRQNAVEVLELALEARPDRLDLARIRDDLRRSVHDPGLDAAVMAQDASFHGRLAHQLSLGTAIVDRDTALEGLPDLPDLPDLPELGPGTLAPAGLTPAGPTIAPQDWPPSRDERLPSQPTMVPDFGEHRERSAPTMIPGEGALREVSSDTFMPSVWTEAASGEHVPVGDSDIDPTEPFSVGALIDGRYRLLGPLGEGGMGAVFKAHDEELDEDIALKVLTVPVRNKAMIDRFRQELRLARRLTHPSIVRLHDMGVHQGFRYITMELLVGADLRRRLEEGVPKRQALSYVVQAARALQAAHDADVVHRDVKPENLFVLDDDRVKVMDFGLARTSDAPSMTVAGMVAGTPAYMAPEQGNSFSSAGAPADQYALGIIAYEVIMGRPPFRHAELLPLIRMHAEDPPPPPREVFPTLSADLERTILVALSKAPEDRFPSCAAFADALAGCI
ncbi:MAG: serine/threonine protein kinase [Alphaproteobacteria bacterium]|nr:serine/threonine protein kinase [Alphaproteobacteria bacterium]